MPEQVDHTSIPSLSDLRWIRECLLMLIQEQQEGVREKMIEIEMYTGMLTRLNIARGDS